MNDHSDALAQRLQTRPANEARNNALAESNRGIALMKKQEALKAVSEIKKHADNLRRLLMELRDREGWKALGYNTWAKCCEEEFGYSKRHANRLILCEKVVERVGPIGPTQPNESQARELSRLPEDRQAEVWKEYTDECDNTDSKPTASGLKYRVDQCLKANEPEPADVAATENDEIEKEEPKKKDKTNVLEMSERKRKNTEQFAQTIADVAITQLERVPPQSPFCDVAYEKIEEWIRNRQNEEPRSKSQTLSRVRWATTGVIWGLQILAFLAKKHIADSKEREDMVKKMSGGLLVVKQVGKAIMDEVK